MKHKPHKGAEARWKNSHSRAVAPCIACLHRLGYGLKRIKRATRASQGFVYRLTLTLPPSGWNPRAIQNERRREYGRAQRATRAVASGETFKRLLARVIKHSARYAQKDGPERKAMQRLRHYEDYKRPQYVMRSRLRKRIRKMIGERKAGRRSQDIIGCTVAEFMEHIQKQFKRGMNWNNRGLWHIDHIIPCTAFDLTDESQVKQCFHFTNMQPLWASENIAKGGRMPANAQPRLLL